MNRTRTLCLTALIVPVLCATLSPADKLAFHPADGTSVSRAWTIKQDFSLDEMQMTMNGKPMPFDLQMEMDMSMSNEIGVTDKIVKGGTERPAELLRTFDKLGSGGSFSVEAAMIPDGGMEKSVKASSKLEGKTVKFLWNDEEKKFDLSFHESEGDSDLLQGLQEDMDLRGVLPGKEVAEGDTWDVDVKTLRALLMPGGDVKLRPEDVGGEEVSGMMPGMDGMSDMSDMIGELLEGDATAEYKGIKEIEGGRYGEIHLKVNISSNNDMSSKMSELVKELPEGLDSMSFDHMDIEFAVESEGTVLWDLAGGFVHSIEMSGKMKMSSDTAMKIGAQGQNISMEYQMTMSGTVSTGLQVTKN